MEVGGFDGSDPVVAALERFAGAGAGGRACCYGGAGENLGGFRQGGCGGCCGAGLALGVVITAGRLVLALLICGSRAVDLLDLNAAGSRRAYCLTRPA